jgi:hypothetical protein
MVNKRFYPFTLTLAGLTLKGNQYDTAKAYYELDGEDLERKLAEIHISDKNQLVLKLLEFDKQYGHITAMEYDIAVAKETLSDTDLQKELLVIDRRWNGITKEEYDYKLIELIHGGSEHITNLPFARLELDKKYGKLTEKEFDKAVFSLGNRPWVDIISSEYNDNDGSDGFSFDLDWNDAFIDLLKNEGYNGISPEAIVEQWFEDKSLDTYLGVLAEHMEEIGDDPEDAHRGYGRGKTLKEQLGGKKTRHS